MNQLPTPQLPIPNPRSFRTPDLPTFALTRYGGKPSSRSPAADSAAKCAFFELTLIALGRIAPRARRGSVAPHR
jgi:hypothetical protein